jgi:radical SAM superfamily enzyme YgiQ (UPF0313 family)
VEENSEHIVDVMNPPIDVEKLKTYKVVGFSVTTPQYDGAVEIAEELLNIRTVIGGPHCLNYEVSETLFSYFIKGDGCKPFLEILNGNSSPVEEEDDPDQLPYRDASLLDYKYFLDGLSVTVVITARGCPNNCYFCEHAGFSLRLKSPGAVKQELKECTDLGFKAIMFFDDLFCISLQRVKSLCDVIKPFGIKFRCFAHSRNFTEDMAKILSEAGCVEIGYGAEHADQKMLDTINKKTTVEQNYNIVKIAHKYGIRVKSFLMVGLPGESEKTVSKLREFIETSGVDDYDIVTYFPYKGTYIYEHLGEFDLQISDAPSLGYYKGKLGKSEVRVQTSHLSSEEIENYQRGLWKIKH